MGGSYLAAKELATAETVLPVLVLRFGLVLPVLFAAGLRARGGLRKLSLAQLVRTALVGGVLAGIFLLETYGVVHTSATNAGLLISLTMVLTPAAESLVAQVRLPRALLAAAGLSVLGVALLTHCSGRGFTRPSLGDALMLLAAPARTAYVLLMSRLRAVREAEPLAVTTVQLTTAVVLFWLLLGVLPDAGPTPWALAARFGAGQWLGLVFLSCFCTLFALAVQTWAVRRTTASRLALLLGTEPLWAAVVGVTLGGNRLGPVGVAGAALVLVGTAWGRRAAPARGADSSPDGSMSGDVPAHAREGQRDEVLDA